MASGQELVGLTVEVLGSSRVRELDTGETLNPEGLQGRAVSCDTSGALLVETFSGPRISIPADRLRELAVASPEEGGFDCIWPIDADADPGDSGDQLTGCLQQKGYCVLQLFGAEAAVDSLYLLAEQLEGAFTRPKRELEEALLGRSPWSKVAWLDGLELDNEGFAFYAGRLGRVHAALAGAGPGQLGLQLGGDWMATLLRQPLLSDREHRRLDGGRLYGDEVDAGAVDRFNTFLQHRRLCLLCVVDTAGGTVQLHPKEEDWSEMTVSLAKNRLLVFRHDLFDYTYRAQGKEDLVLQTWLTDSLLPVEAENAVLGPSSSLVKPGPVAPNGPGMLTLISSVTCLAAGRANCGESAWNMFMANADGYVLIPSLRFDLDVYYDANGDFGKTRTKHSALCMDEDLMLFDNVFFEWTEEETYNYSINSRMVMQCGYDLVFRAGLRRNDLRGQRVGTYLGHMASFEAVYGHGGAVKINHFLGLTGRATMVDTACSSTMVSFNLGHQDLCLGRADAAMVMGTSLLMDIEPYIAMSSGRMISSRGRSHTFDHSADGYGRGEGCSAIFLERAYPDGTNPIRKRATQQQPAELGRFAASALNQDGRSASITAPSGPSQTACIRQSLREAGLTPDQVTVGECHGTGTALGDPIEVGSSRMVNDPFARTVPLFLGAAKTQVGHLELGAGGVGALRAITMLVHGTCPPNCHLYQLNEHFSNDGFPVLMPTEPVDMGVRATFIGVNSFGFGGTNGRAELWGKARAGHLSEAPRTSRLQRIDYLSVAFPSW